VTYLPQASTRHKGVCVCTHGTGVRETEARAFEARVRRLWGGGRVVLLCREEETDGIADFVGLAAALHGAGFT
jgi:hypothetical protein